MKGEEWRRNPGLGGKEQRDVIVRVWDERGESTE